MFQRTAAPRISVVIPTYNRADLLCASLESLTRQTLPADDFEVVVVNDGSSDATEAVCQEFADHVRLKYQYIKNSGISAAKNLGIFSSSAPLLLFFDDDDIASPTLLEEHLHAHEEYPDKNVAVLGYTAWAPWVEVTPVMEYIIDVGQQLFAYRNLRHGQRLDHTYFWGGRSSCKRAFLTAYGIFNQSFRAIIEDIELGYRLSKFNLIVVFDRRAVSHMVRPITFDDFCRRSERQGLALYLFSQLHDDPAVRQYCQVQEALSKWETARARLPNDIVRIKEIESILAGPAAWRTHAVIQELQTLYKRSFAAFRFKGIVEAAGAHSQPSPLLLRRSYNGTAGRRQVKL
jgi:glycosyltransferase involved in cell wall biosynthesis